MNFSNNLIYEILPVILVMFSAIIHEVAHGWAALKLGDTTARDAGRLTLNPKAHLDPFGSVILPIVMTAMGGPIFAFAKPVPYNPYNLRHGQRDEAIIALAGPASNLLQALVAAALYAGVYRLWVDGTIESYELGYNILITLFLYLSVNLSLMFFNLIPLPPLDGSKIVMPLLHGAARQKYYQIQHYAMPILLVALYVLPSLIGFDPVGTFLDWAVSGTLRLLMGVFGVL